MAEETLSPKKSRKQLKREKRLERAKLKVKLFPANKKDYHVSKLLNLLRFLFYPIHTLVYPYRIHGAKKVGKGACIFVGNHYCLWDIFYPAHMTKEAVHFLMKDSIFAVPVIGRFAVGVGAIGAMRDGSDVRTLMEGMRVLKSGEKLSMFPEGTRNKVSEEEFLPFHNGAALMAIKTKTPVIPFVICNKPKPFHFTHVMVGGPMELSEYYDRKLAPSEYEEAEEKVKNRLYELRDEFRSSRKSKKSKKK